MDIVGVLLSSALVSSVFGALAGYVSQKRLAANQARVDYDLAARRRLYEAIGPLRFQLLIASRDVVRRVRPHHNERWNMDPAAYYASSFIYRILRPFAICDLISRKMATADFGVDPSAQKILRFEAAAYRFLTSDDALPYHTALDWGRETQHVFRDNLRLAASQLIDPQRSEDRVLDYSEFLDRDLVDNPAVARLSSLFGNCDANLTENSILWVRICGFAYACAWLINDQGESLGFDRQQLDIRGMVASVSDEEVLGQLGNYPAIFDRTLAEGL